MTYPTYRTYLLSFALALASVMPGRAQSPPFGAPRDLWLAVDTSAPETALKDAVTAKPARLPWGNPVRVHLALFDGADALLADFDGLDTLYLEADATRGDEAETPLVFEELDSGDIDDTLTLEQWAARSNEHAVLDLTAAQMQIPMGGANERNVWLVIHAKRDDESPVVLGMGTVRVYATNAVPTDTPPPEYDPPYPTPGEIEERMLPAGGTAGQVLSKVDGDDYDVEWTSSGGSMSAAQIIAALLTVDGTGSMLDSDLLDGLSSAAFATAAQGATADTALQPDEIATWTVADGTSNPVSEWIPARYANLAAIQAAGYPVTATTDEIDWAVIQRELNRIGAGTRTDQFVRIPSGIYMLNKSITVKGPGVTLYGDGQYDTVLKFTADVDGLLFAPDDGGRAPHAQRVERLCLVGLIPPASTKVGLVAGKSDKSANYAWQGIQISQVLIQGFDVGIFGANMPMLHVTSTTILGCTTCAELAKCDTFWFESCLMGNQEGWDGEFTEADTLVYHIRDASEATDGLTGNNFAGTISGGDNGSFNEYLLLEGACTVAVRDVHTEDVQGDYWAKVDGDGRLMLDQILNIGSAAGIPGILLAPEVGGFIHLRAERVTFEGITGDHIRSQDNDYYYLPDVIAPELEVKWRTDDGTLIFSSPATHAYFPIKPVRWLTHNYTDTDANNLTLLARTTQTTWESGYNLPSGLTHYYKSAGGAHRRSDLVNDALGRVLLTTVTNSGNTAANIATATTLATVDTATSELYAAGNTLRLEARGTFATGADDKRLRLSWQGADVFDSGVITDDGDWTLDVDIVRGASATVGSHLIVYGLDGLPPIRDSVAVPAGQFNTASTLALSGYGEAISGVVIHSIKVTYRR